MNVVSASLQGGPIQARPGKTSPADVAAKFESLLMMQMFNAMQNTVEKSGLLDGGSAEEMYREMLNQALSDELARRGGLGLAEQIARRIDAYKQAEKEIHKPHYAQDVTSFGTDE